MNALGSGLAPEKTRAPTARQKQVLQLIDALTTARGFAPTVRELCSALEIRSTNGVQDHLKSLKARGFLTWTRYLNRTLLQLTDAGRKAAA